MSRIGKQPVKLPKGVECKLEGANLSVKGPKGTLAQWVDPRIKVEIDGGASEVRFTRSTDLREDR